MAVPVIIARILKFLPKLTKASKTAGAAGKAGKAAKTGKSVSKAKKAKDVAEVTGDSKLKDLVNKYGNVDFSSLKSMPNNGDASKYLDVQIDEEFDNQIENIEDDTEAEDSPILKRKIHKKPKKDVPLEAKLVMLRDEYEQNYKRAWNLYVDGTITRDEFEDLDREYHDDYHSRYQEAVREYQEDTSSESESDPVTNSNLLTKLNTIQGNILSASKAGMSTMGKMIGGLFNRTYQMLSSLTSSVASNTKSSKGNSSILSTITGFFGGILRALKGGSFGEKLEKAIVGVLLGVTLIKSLVNKVKSWFDDIRLDLKAFFKHPFDSDKREAYRASLSSKIEKTNEGWDIVTTDADGKEVDRKSNVSSEQVDKLKEEDPTVDTSEYEKSRASSLNEKRDSVFTHATGAGIEYDVNSTKDQTLPNDVFTARFESQDLKGNTVVRESKTFDDHFMDHADSIHDGIDDRDQNLLSPDILPIDYKVGANRVTSTFNESRLKSDNKSRRNHQAVDIAAVAGTPIYATMDGTVGYKPRTKNNKDFTMFLSNGEGLIMSYTHVVPGVENGDYVRKGQVIGSIKDYPPVNSPGGDHLHYNLVIDSNNNGEADRNEQRVNPVEYVAKLGDMTEQEYNLVRDHDNLVTQQKLDYADGKHTTKGGEYASTGKENPVVSVPIINKVYPQAKIVYSNPSEIPNN